MTNSEEKRLDEQLAKVREMEEKSKDIKKDDMTKNIEMECTTKYMEQNNAEQKYNPYIKQSNNSSENVVQQKKNNILSDGNLTLTKFEGLLMLLISILLTVVLNFGINNSIHLAHLKDIEMIQSLQTQILSLTTKVDSLESLIVNLENKDNNNNNDNNDNNNDFDDDFDQSPFLGVAFTEVEGNGIGLEVAFVYEYSPAKFAGIKEGDIITSIDGHPIRTFEDLSAVISASKAGDTLHINLIVVVDGKITTQIVDATLTYRGNFELD